MGYYFLQLLKVENVLFFYVAGSRAYACQCTWRSVVDILDVESDPKLKWVCGKHG